MQELRGKARYYEKTGLIPTLDASAAVVKSDSLVPDSLRDALRHAFARLQDDQAGDPDWHPRSGEMVQDLVHPSLYPLIYGRTNVLPTEVVGVADAIDKWAGKGTMLEGPAPQPNSDRPHRRGPFRDRVMFGTYDVPESYWSDKYQWLPSNLAFQDDGSVRLTSYVNNLHPTRYPDIYKTVERLIETVIPAWDQCLMSYGSGLPFGSPGPYGPGRKGSRFAVPDDADDESPGNWVPADASETAEVEIDWDQHEVSDHEDEDDYDDDEERETARNERKWKILRKPVLREPDSFKDVQYDPYAAPEPTKKDGGSRFNAKSQNEKKCVGGLFKNFKSSGLQVIVKMASIELTPDKPEFPAGSWHVCARRMDACNDQN